MRRLLIRDLFSQIDRRRAVKNQRSAKHLEWAGCNLIGFVNEFVEENRLLESHFIRRMNKTFRTTRFELFLKKWIVEYLEKLFRVFDDFSELTLEDNPINRFGAAKYREKFEVLPEIDWKSQPNLLKRISSISVRPLMVLSVSLNMGMMFWGKRKRYKVMREALWGLYGVGGYYMHDDFVVDGDKIKKKDLLLFSRGVPTESGRLKGYHDARKSPYDHFNLSAISIGVCPFFLRIIPKYIALSSMILFREINSTQFLLYWSAYLSFLYSALPYEKIFSNFEIVSDLGHNSFASGHIAEAIVCQNHGTKYHLMNWSDDSITINSYLLNFMGCDGYLVWGTAHSAAFEIDPQVLILTGYMFKRPIKEVMSNRGKILSEMGIRAKGKVITFFDESFGGDIKMTEENFIVFWEAAFKLAQIEKDNTIVIKPKSMGLCNNLSDGSKRRFRDIKDKMEKTPNIYIMDERKWSFIECIGVSDIVVTQGMTSSATIAIICGIEGLYLDEARYDHPFSKPFKDRIVFDDRLKLLTMINRIIEGSESPSKDIPKSVLREYDAYEDDMGLDRFRDALLNEHDERNQCPRQNLLMERAFSCAS